MRLEKSTIVYVWAAVIAFCTPAYAYEFGSPGWAQKGGIALGGATAGTPPPGLYMFNQIFTYQSKMVGPGAPNVGGNSTPVSVAAGGIGVVWVPGWTFLGATYNAVAVLPGLVADVGSPLNVSQAGIHNPYFVPAELSWKLGDSGFFVKTGLGMYVPIGTKTGFNGLGNAGSPWWTFQPELIVSYLNDGWNLTTNVFYEMNTESTVTGYKSGDILHAEFTATKTIGNWTLGPVAYYAGQVTNDRSSAFYGGAINVNRYDIWAAGGLIGYNFGPVTLNVWALNELSSRASGGTPIGGQDTAIITKGYSVIAQLSYRLWAPSEEPVVRRRPAFPK